MEQETKKQIKKLLEENPIILFMKGAPGMPMCGFSAKALHTIKKQDIEFTHFNVLENPSVWQGIKEYGNWPTIPQLYVQGKLIGGCDIILELEENGTLKEILTKNK